MDAKGAISAGGAVRRPLAWAVGARTAIRAAIAATAVAVEYSGPPRRPAAIQPTAQVMAAAIAQRPSSRNA